MNQKEADKAIESVFPANRYRWCEANICACMGCVNRSLKTDGVTKEQWENWLKRNPIMKADELEAIPEEK